MPLTLTPVFPRDVRPLVGYASFAVTHLYCKLAIPLPFVSVPLMVTVGADACHAVGIALTVTFGFVRSIFDTVTFCVTVFTPFDNVKVYAPFAVAV